MTDRVFSRTLRYLQGAACLVVILWGIRRTSEILVPILLSLLLAFGFLPLPNWLTGKLKLHRGTAAALVAALMGLLILGTVPVLDWKFAQVKEKLPIYQEHAMSFYKTLAASLEGHGIKISAMDVAMKSLSDRIPEYARMVLPQAAGFLGDGLLIAIMAS